MGISHSLKIIVVAALEIIRYNPDRFILVSSVLHFRHPLSEKSERGRERENFELPSALRLLLTPTDT